MAFGIFPRRSRLRVAAILCVIPILMSALYILQRSCMLVNQGTNGITGTGRPTGTPKSTMQSLEVTSIDTLKNISYASDFGDSSVLNLRDVGTHVESKTVADKKPGVIAEDLKNVEIGINVTQVEEEVVKMNQTPWKFNSTLLTKERREMQRYFDPRGAISLTKQDVAIGSTINFYYSHPVYIFAVPRTMYNILPERKLFQDQQFNTCAVVGNGGILLQSNCGEEIDSHDFVIRCNFARINGFEKDVGRRTDILTFNPSILKKRYGQLFTVFTRMKFQSDLSKFGKIVLWVPAFAHHNTIPTFRILLDYLDEMQEFKKNLQVAVPGNFLEGMFSYWETKGITEKRLSTGLVMYSIATGICREVHLYGFFPFKEFNGTKLPYHYDEKYSGRDYAENDKYHRMPTEFAYFQKIHNKGALKLTVGKCTQNTPNIA